MSPSTILASLTVHRGTLQDRSLDQLEAMYLAVIGSLIATVWLGFTAAEFGVDRPLVVLGLGTVLLASALVVGSRRRRQKPPLLDCLVLAVVLAIGIALFFPPDEWILGALDPGSYVNSGATIARTGSIVFSDETLRSLTPDVRAGLFPAPASRVPGFYLETGRFDGLVPVGFETSTHLVVPHGLHLFPAYLSFGFALGGIRTELLLVPLLAILALTGFFLLARRMFGPAHAMVATSFLALSPAEVWFARYPDAELLAQLLWFTGFLAFVAALDTDSRFSYALAGFSLGALHLTKIETITLPVIVGLGLIYFSMVTGFRRRWLWFLLPYLTLLGQGIIHALGIATWYTETSFSKALPLLSAPLILLFLGLGLALGMPFAASARVRVAARTILTASIWTKLATYVLPAGVGALALFLYFIRPLGIDAIPPGSATDIAAQRVNDLQSFVRLGWFLTPAGILVGSIGWALLLRRELTRRFAFPLVAIGIDTVLTLNQMNITPVYYWAARRWITLVIPGMCLMIAYVLLYLFPKPGKSVIRMVFPVGVTIAIVLGFIQSDRPLLGYVEYRGAVDQIGALAGTIPENGIVLFPDSDAARRFSPPLDYIFGRESFFILPNVAARQSAAQAARQWQDGGRPVYWVATAEIGDPSLIGLAGDIVARQRISLPEKQTTHDRPPGEDGLFQQDLVVWKLRS